MKTRLRKGERGTIVSKTIPSGCPGCRKAIEKKTKQYLLSRIKNKMYRVKISSKKEIPMPRQKIAVLVALNNYPGFVNDLRGCINDSMEWEKRLKNKFSFTDITTIRDDKATVNNVKKITQDKFLQCKEGDSFAFIYSGHGTWTPDKDGDEADGKDEALCMYDGLIADDFFRDLFKFAPKDLNLIMVSDSCHSGSMTRAPMADPNIPDTYIKPRFMVPPEKWLKIEEKLRPGSRLFDSARAQDVMNEVLLTGCMDTQTSADAFLAGRYFGALSFHCFKVIDSNPNTITYDAFYKQLRQYLPSSMYSQVPQLECTPQNKNKVIFG